MNQRTLVLGIFLSGCLSLSGCLGQHEPAVEIEAYVPLPLAELGRGRQGSVTGGHYVITRAEDWTAYQDSLRPLQPFEPVDFALEMLVLAAAEVPSGGYDLRFEEIEDAGTHLVAHYRLYTPGDDCRPTFGSSTVFQVVRTMQSDKPVTFERTEERTACTEP